MSISELERIQILREAGAFARVIVAWHREIGLNMAPHRMMYDGEPRMDSLDEYRRAVEVFVGSDLGTLEAQAEVAKTQICGTFEWFFHEVIPSSLWVRFAEGLAGEPSGHLFEAARHIQQLHARLTASQPTAEEQTREFHASGRGITVQYSSRSELQRLARHHYAAYVEEERDGIGGVNFLLSSSLERSAYRSDETGEITLLTPEYLGFRAEPISASDHLLSRLRAGQIRIESVEGF